MIKAIHAWKPVSKRPMGRPKIRWEDDVKKRYTEVGKGMQSNTTMSIEVYLMATLDNYMFRPLLAIFRLSSRELNVLLYTLCAHVV